MKACLLFSCLISPLALITACGESPNAPTKATAPASLVEDSTQARPTTCSRRNLSFCTAQERYNFCMEDRYPSQPNLGTINYCRREVGWPELPPTTEVPGGGGQYCGTWNNWCTDIQHASDVMTPKDSCFPYACDDTQQSVTVTTTQDAASDFIRCIQRFGHFPPLDAAARCHANPEHP